jgi:ribA/ribD-fused uncharacterized protein
MNHKIDNDTQVFFYEQDFYVLSNFSAFNVEWRGYVFDTSEQAYHWAKFAPDGDERFYIPKGSTQRLMWEVRSEILTSRSAHDALKIAEAKKEFRRPDWISVRVDIMRDILRAKFDQHPYVRQKLLATGDRELIEDSWRDDFWGWGPNRDGQNMLGKLWMEIRRERLEVAA